MRGRVRAGRLEGLPCILKMSDGGLALMGFAAIAAVETRAVEGTMVRRGVRSG